MTEKKPKIYFLGAGAFAVPVLEKIARSQTLDLVGAGTQPDRAAGRKRILTPSPLGKWADENGISCERIPSVNVEEFLRHIAELGTEMIVVVSFGQILKETLLNLTPFGCLNVHASLLPKYRGASPIKSAILNGERYTGVSFMKMDKGLDTGPVYESVGMELPSDADAAVMENRLACLAADRIERCIEKIVEGKLVPEPQNHEIATVSRKIRKCDGAVDWREDAVILERKVRAYRKWPTVSFGIPQKGRVIHAKITAASCTSWEAPGGTTPGKFIAYVNNKMMISCGRGALILERILPEGKKEMSVADFLNGSRLAVGDILLNGQTVTPGPDSGSSH